MFKYILILNSMTATLFKKVGRVATRLKKLCNAKKKHLV